MIIGVPQEIKTEENRVAVTPTGVAGLVARNHKVLIQKGAGLGSGLSDRAYQSAGATIVDSHEEVWRQAICESAAGPGPTRMDARPRGATRPAFAAVPAS